MTMYDLSDPKLRPLSYEFARQAHAERTRLMQAYLRSTARGLAAFVFALAKTCIKLAKRLAHERLLRSDLRALQKLDDRTLADIGVSRGALEYLLRKGTTAGGLRIAATYPRRSPRPNGARKVDANNDSFKAQKSAV
jgi:uncharacterized protein YjiS (DUF1127 family)